MEGEIDRGLKGGNDREKARKKTKRREALKQLRKEAQMKEKFSRELAERVEIPGKILQIQLHHLIKV